MSEENGKVCCNCRHCIRTGEETNIKCYCDITGIRLFYISVMTHCCKHWSREKTESEKVK